MSSPIMRRFDRNLILIPKLIIEIREHVLAFQRTEKSAYGKRTFVGNPLLRHGTKTAAPKENMKNASSNLPPLHSES